LGVLGWLLYATVTAGVSCPAAATQVAKTRYASAEYGAAIGAVAGVETCTDGTPTELAEALRWRAEAKAAGGDSAGAVEAFGLLWVIAPGYALDPLESPKFHELFKQGKARAEKARTVFARLVRSGDATLVEVSDPRGRVKKVNVFFDGAETPAAKRPDGAWEVKVPVGAAAATVRLESGDAVIFSSPSIKVDVLAPAPEPAARAAVRAPPPESSSPLPLVLGIAGGVVVAAVIAGVVTGVVLGNKKIDGSLGSVQLPLQAEPGR
jgi:hypothetical protein